MKLWKEMSDPHKATKHPYYLRRYIVTNDFDPILTGDENFYSDSGSIICSLTDHPSQEEIGELIANSSRLLYLKKKYLKTKWIPKYGFNPLPWKVTDVFVSLSGKECVEITKYLHGRNSPAVISVKKLKTRFRLVEEESPIRKHQLL